MGTYALKPEERTGVLAAPDQKQYEYFLDKAADEQQVWSLTDGERWANVLAEDGSTNLMAVWPHPLFALAVRDGGWEELWPESIEVHDFLKLCETLAAEGRSVGVMPNAQGDVFEVSALGAAADIRAELDRVE